ncbi:MAG: PilZ-like domain-containing protein [Geobacteraceae bacterium]|nr:PilZ-like domain-containing protein [Geobacteraceae bacterium]
MAKKKVEYDQYFKAAQQVKLAIISSGTMSREINGEIAEVAGDSARIEILGEGIPESLSAKKQGTKISLAGWSGWGFYKTDVIIDKFVSSKEIAVSFVGGVEEKQRREYFRLDVSLPVRVDYPAAQSPVAIRELWTAIRDKSQSAPPPRMAPTGKGYRVVLPGGTDIQPQNVNLSGGGLRMRTPAAIGLGDLVHVDLYLPVAPPRIINTVAEVLRCNELTLHLEKESVFIAAMKFIHIDEQDRESIIAYLFAEQRIQLQAERELPTPGR